MKKILIPIDASEESKRAVEMGKVFAKSFGCSVVLLHVIHVMLPVGDVEADQLLPKGTQLQAEAFLKEVKDSFGALANQVETVVLKGNTAEQIINYSETWTEIDAIIMGSHGMGAPAKRILIGSVTNKVLHHTNKPVFVIR